MERRAGRRGLLTIEYNAIFAHEDAVMATVHCAACNMKAESAPAERRFCVRHRVDNRIRVSRLGDFIEKTRGAYRPRTDDAQWPRTDDNQ